MFLTLLPYLTVVANLVVVLGVLFGLNQRVRQLRLRSIRDEKTLEAQSTRFSLEMTELQTRVLELERELQNLDRSPQAALPTADVVNGVNHTLRSKVLKMHRLGQSADRIAGSLRVPKGEVDLLVKVHKIVMRPYEEVVLSPLGGETVEKV